MNRRQACTDGDLDQLRGLLLKLGECARLSVSDGLRALVSGDADLAASIIAGQAGARQAYLALEDGCEHLVSQHGPNLQDRAVRMTVLNVAAGLNLLDVALQGQSIAVVTHQARLPGARAGKTPWSEIEYLGNLSLALLDLARTALVEQEPKRARVACELAAHIDALYLNQFDILPGYAHHDTRLTELPWILTRVVQALRRVGDDVLNIAEKVMDANAAVDKSDLARTTR